MTRFRLLIISLILLLTACLGYLAVDNVMQTRNQKSLSNEIQVDRQRLAAIPPADAGLAQQLSQAKSNNQRALALATAVPQSSTEVINTLIELANQYSLVISPFNTESWTSVSLGSSSYKMLPISLEIQGSLPHLIAFVQKLGDTSAYPYLIIQGMSIDDQLTAANKTDTTVSISAELKLDIVQRNISQNPGESK